MPESKAHGVRGAQNGVQRGYRAAPPLLQRFPKRLPTNSSMRDDKRRAGTESVSGHPKTIRAVSLDDSQRRDETFP